MRAKRQTEIFQSQIHDAVKEAIDSYLNTPIETRHALEEKGENLATLMTSYLIPVIQNIKISNLLVVMEEGIGNMVMMTPALRTLKATNPNLKVTVWCRKPSDEVIRGWECVDKVITEFDYNYYDLCYLSIWSSQTKANYEQIINQYCKGIFETPFKDIPEIIQHYALPEFFDAGSEPSPTFCMQPNDERKKELDKILGEQEYIVFGDTTLNLMGAWDRKRWPYYFELAEMINKKFPQYKIYMIGDSEDKQRFLNEKVWPANVSFDLCGSINIPDLAYVLSKAHLYVGNDTGPSHIAGAVGTESYVLFGPTKIAKNKPIGDNVNILTKSLWCSPCLYTERWSKCQDWRCMSDMTAKEVYDCIFYNQKMQSKKKLLLVGDFSGGALRNEVYIKNTLEKDFKLNVIPFAYREVYSKNENQIDMSYNLLNEIINTQPDYVLICGGHGIIGTILFFVNYFCPNTKLINWYVDNNGGPEEWFRQISVSCDYTFWSTGDPKMLSNVFSKLQRPCNFLPIVPDDKSYFPVDGKKDIDVLFVGTPHSPHRLALLEHLINSGIKIQIHGDGDWPEFFKPYVKPGVFDKAFNSLLNRAKIVINTNVRNNVPLYFSDRVFYPMAVKTVGLNHYVPKLEEMFEDGKHMVFFNSPEEAVTKINELLANDELRKTISEEGYKLYKEKYTLKHILQTLMETING